MRTLAVMLALTLLAATASSASAQAIDLTGLLDALGGAGGLAGGPTGSDDTGTVPSTPSTDGDETAEETPIPQENVRNFRSRRPGLMVGAAVARYQERTSNLGQVGPSEAPMPDVPEKQRVMPVIVNDLIGSFFDFVNQFITGLNLLTTIQSGTLSLGSGGVNFNTLLQQLLGSQSAASVREVTAMPTDPSAEPSPAVVVPALPTEP